MFPWMYIFIEWLLSDIISVHFYYYKLDLSLERVSRCMNFLLYFGDFSQARIPVHWVKWNIWAFRDSDLVLQSGVREGLCHFASGESQSRPMFQDYDTGDDLLHLPF